MQLSKSEIFADLSHISLFFSAFSFLRAQGSSCIEEQNGKLIQHENAYLWRTLTAIKLELLDLCLSFCLTCLDVYTWSIYIYIDAMELY